MRSISLRTLLCAIGLLVFTTTASAQFNAGIQGTVADPTGAVVTGATITLTNNDTGKTQQGTTSDEGFYRFSGLAPGNYTLKVEQSGFNPKTVENVVVSAEDVRGLDVTLETGGITAAVTITDEQAPQLNTEDANVRGVITTEDLQRQPQIGRNPYELVRTAPGVLGDTARGGAGNTAIFIPGTEELVGASNSGIFQTENQPQISANGQRVSSNNYQIDGVSVNSLGLGGAAVVTPNQESVKEVAVVTSSYSAEDGRNTGAQVKVVSNSGTNEFHGSGVFNYSSPKLNAFNKFHGRPTAPRAPTRVEQYERKFAGSLGGPIIKNKLFFFTSYEGLRRSNTTFSERFIETPEFRAYVQQVRPNGLAAQLFSLAGVEPRTVATGLIPNAPPPGSVPINGAAGLSFDIGSLNVPLGQKIGTRVLDGVPDITLARLAFPNNFKGNQYNFRTDYNRGTSDQFAVSTYFTTLNNIVPSGNGRPFEDGLFKPFNSAATFTYIRTFSPTVLNEARFNFTRFHIDEIESVGASNLSIPFINISDFNFTGGNFGNLGIFGGPNFGVDRGRPNIRTQNTYELRDALTMVRANRTYKFGGEARFEQDNNNLASQSRPEFVFDNFLSFANDAVFFENILVDPTTGGPANGQRYFRSNSYGLFVQTDWKYRPNLTFNIGLRYEYQTPVTEKEGRLSNYVFGPNGLVDGSVVPVDSLYDPDRNNFAPRLGFAWSPQRFEDKLVVRGGFGIAYDRLFSNLFTNARFNPPFAALGGGRGSICCAGTNDPVHPGPIIYSFAAPDSPFSYPVNPLLVGGIDPQTGGILDPGGPQVLAGGFIKRDIPIEINGNPREMPNSYIYNYSLEFQYQLPYRTVISLGYVGNMGRKLIRTVDLNRFIPGDTFDLNRDRVQTKDVAGNAVTPRLTGNPNFDRIFYAMPDVNSSYNSMLITVTRQYAQGFQLEGTYRWSKSIDTSSFGRGAQQTNPNDQRLERGPSDFDVRHNLIISGLWDIPLFRHRRDFVGKAFGGFQLNGILTLHSGFPFTPLVFGPDNADPNGDGFLPDRPTQYFGGVIENPSTQDFINGIFPNGATSFGVAANCDHFPICFNSIVRGLPGIGRNSFRGPGFRSFDFSLVKQTGLPGFLHLGERANLEARANFFNVFNILNLPSFPRVGSSVDAANTGDFGRINSGLAGRVVELQFRLSF